MANRKSVEATMSRIERELAREHRERALHDEARRGLAPYEDEFRFKDARERADSGQIKRRSGC